MVSGVASNDDDGEERRVVDEDANREEPAAVGGRRDDGNDVDKRSRRGEGGKGRGGGRGRGARAPRRHGGRSEAPARGRRADASGKAAKPPAAPARGCARGCAGAWIAFGDECPTRRTFAFSDTAVQPGAQPGVQPVQPGANVPLACYFVKAFDASWLDVNHRPRYTRRATRAAGGGTSGKTRARRAARAESGGPETTPAMNATNTTGSPPSWTRRAASRARRLTLAGGARGDADWGADWDAHGGAHGGAHGPYGYACAVATAEELAGAAEEAACRVRSSPSFSTGPIGEQEGRASVEPVDALAVAARRSRRASRRCAGGRVRRAVSHRRLRWTRWRPPRRRRDPARRTSSPGFYRPGIDPRRRRRRRRPRHRRRPGGSRS